MILIGVNPIQIYLFIYLFKEKKSFLDTEGEKNPNYKLSMVMRGCASRLCM